MSHHEYGTDRAGRQLAAADSAIESEDGMLAELRYIEPMLDAEPEPDLLDPEPEPYLHDEECQCHPCHMIRQEEWLDRRYG